MEHHRNVLCHLAITLVGLSLTVATPAATYKLSPRGPFAATSVRTIYTYPPVARSTKFTKSTSTRSTITPTRPPTSTTNPNPTSIPITTPIPTPNATSTLPNTWTPNPTPTPTPTPTSTLLTPTSTPTLTNASNSAPTTDPSITDAPTSSDESATPPVAGDRRAVDGQVNTDMWIAVTTAAACLIILTIVLVVVGVRRRKCRQKPTPSTGSTGHRDTAAENVYTVSEETSHERVMMPLTTIQLELPARGTPNPEPEVSAPSPGTSVRDPETPHWEPGTTPDVLDGGASGGQAREPDVYAVVRRDRQEDDDLNVKENAAYGQLL